MEEFSVLMEGALLRGVLLYLQWFRGILLKGVFLIGMCFMNGVIWRGITGHIILYQV